MEELPILENIEYRLGLLIKFINDFVDTLNEDSELGKVFKNHPAGKTVRSELSMLYIYLIKAAGRDPSFKESAVFNYLSGYKLSPELTKELIDGVDITPEGYRDNTPITMFAALLFDKTMRSLDEPQFTELSEMLYSIYEETGQLYVLIGDGKNSAEDDALIAYLENMRTDMKNEMMEDEPDENTVKAPQKSTGESDKTVKAPKKG